MDSKQVVGIEQLPSCEDSEGDCEDVTWVETIGSSNAVKKMGKAKKGIAIEIGKDTTDVPLLGVIIWEI